MNAELNVHFSSERVEASVAINGTLEEFSAPTFKTQLQIALANVLKQDAIAERLPPSQPYNGPAATNG